MIGGPPIAAGSYITATAAADWHIKQLCAFAAKCLRLKFSRRARPSAGHFVDVGIVALLTLPIRFGSPPVPPSKLGSQRDAVGGPRKLLMSM